MKLKFLYQQKWKVTEEHGEILLIFWIQNKILNCAYLSEFGKYDVVNKLTVEGLYVVFSILRYFRKQFLKIKTMRGEKEFHGPTWWLSTWREQARRRDEAEANALSLF